MTEEYEPGIVQNDEAVDSHRNGQEKKQSLRFILFTSLMGTNHDESTL